MRAVLKENEGCSIHDVSLNQDSGVMTLLRSVMAQDGRPFEDRLANAILRKRIFLPIEVREMAEAHLRSYGRDVSMISLADFCAYRGRVVKELLCGKSLPSEMGKGKKAEIMFFGALLLLLDRQSGEYSIAKSAWNDRVQRHYRLA